MAEESGPRSKASTSNLSRKRLVRGLTAIVASLAIAFLIRIGFAEPNPDLRWAYLICGAVGLWGFIDIVRGVIGFQRSS